MTNNYLKQFIVAKDEMGKKIKCDRNKYIFKNQITFVSFNSYSLP